MLILLPPSEGKTPAPKRRRPVDVSALSFPDLTDARVQVGDALAAVSARSDALEVLGVGASVEVDVRANIDLWSAPAAPAGQIYSGVLYDALDLATVSPQARRRATNCVLVVSALWGAMRLTDRVPAYRLSMTVDLPGIGPLARFWRPHLESVLDSSSERTVAVDCRSAPYRAAWPGDPTRTVHISVLSADSRTAVSHMAKHTRGLVARHLCARSGTQPRSPERLAEAVGEVFECALTPPRTGRSPWNLQVVQP